MADLESTRTQTLSREETAKLLVSLADALQRTRPAAARRHDCSAARGERMQTEVEVEVDENEVELEIELKWSLRERVKK